MGEHASRVPGWEGSDQRRDTVDLDAALLRSLRPGELAGVPFDERFGVRGDVEVRIDAWACRSFAVGGFPPVEGDDLADDMPLELRLVFRLEPHKAGIVARLNYDQCAAIPGAIRKNHATVETDGKRLAGIDLDRQRARHKRVEGSAKWMRNASQSLEIVIRQLEGDGTDKVSAIADQALHRRSIFISGDCRQTGRLPLFVARCETKV